LREYVNEGVQQLMMEFQQGRKRKGDMWITEWWFLIVTSDRINGFISLGMDFWSWSTQENELVLKTGQRKEGLRLSYSYW
jgi:hypothetical protein